MRSDRRQSAVRATMRPMRAPSALIRVLSAAAAGLVWLASAGAMAAAAPVAAGGPPIGPVDPPSFLNLVFGWTFEPFPTLGIVAALVWWRWAVRRVNDVHSDHPVPPRRTWTFVGGQFAIAVALMSGIDRYDTTLFSVHMVQHILLILVAAPLIALSAPITLLLRVASHETRRRWILPVLHSRVMRVLSFPVTGWLSLAALLWAAHFSPLFNATLEDPFLHDLEHVAFLTAALLFWWPAVALDPSPWRMAHPVRTVHIFMQMTQNTFLAFVLLNVESVLYVHYATVVRTWGLSPLDDQRLAAGLMWIVGDVIFIGSIMLVVRDWFRSEERDSGRNDRRAAVQLADIRIREQRLAERLAQERGERGG
jgi:cytochrome c oxidase assembly factor CtaG